jgi:eukaryotic-like serine/threonine-protein kinase
MDGDGDWAQCRLVGLDVESQTRQVGPAGACTSADWSPDGNWMYFAAWVEGQSHIWRQRFPAGVPEQITFGPTEEEGVAVEPDGKTLITSVGSHESAIWIHDSSGEHQLSSEGEVASLPAPAFSPDLRALYYLLRRGPNSYAELWRTMVDSGRSEAVFPGISMNGFDLSPDGTQVVYTTEVPGGTTQLWLAPVDRSSSATKVNVSGARFPHFGQNGLILFQRAEGNTNYLEQINPNGSSPSKVLPYPIEDFQSISPSRRWVVAAIPKGDQNLASIAAIPLDGGAPRRICAGYCFPSWSTNGKFLFVPVEEASRTSPGRSLAIPTGPGESLPELPTGGIWPSAKPDVVQGAQSPLGGSNWCRATALSIMPG